MIRSRFSLLGVLLAAVGLMALCASSAQAEPLAEWLVLETNGGKLVTGAALEAETFQASLENSTGSLLATVLAIPLELLCTALSLNNAHPGPEGKIKEGALAVFTGCVALNAKTKVKLANCSPHSPGKATGTIETLDWHALLKLHELKATGEKHDTLLILPDDKVKEHFVTIEMGEGCAVGESLPIIGLLALWDCVNNEEWLLHKAVHLVTEFKPLTDLKIAGQAASLDGSVNISLVSNRQFAGDPK